MSSQAQALNSILEEFTAQRRYREQKRTEYLRRFEAVRLSLGFRQIKEQVRNHPPHLIAEPQVLGTNQQVLGTNQQVTGAPRVPPGQVPSHQSSGPRASEPLTPEEQTLLAENSSLTATLEQLQEKSGQQIAHFKTAIDQAKTLYVTEIQKLVDRSNASKKENESKLKKLKEQTEKSIEKNQEIETINTAIKSEIENSSKDQPPEELLKEIRKEYDEKIASFKAVFESSNEKIEALEKDFNEEEFIESTLNNEELLKSIEANASKAEEAAKILEDYKALNEGKKQILVQLLSSMEMKEKEIAKMIELQQKMKIIMDRLNSEKQQYLKENNQMARELMEIKELLMGAVGQSQE